ncbi:MAG TPA: cbb3-type cytochrome oxidase assembly protein CcoS [Vineibacter sp.]|nr:cbb3-type cytochrome oxidase assembly protein CcoS [Vineibacter sp.]
MNAMFFLLPIAVLLGGAALAAFLWALRAGQFDDLEGDGSRILFDELPSGSRRDRS